MSRPHFLRSFKREFGYSLIEYQRQLRMNAATRLRTVADWGAREIAHELGYGNVRYFTKVFTEQIGMLPIRYRKKSQAEV